MQPPWRTPRRGGRAGLAASERIGPPTLDAAPLGRERRRQLVVEPVPRSVAEARRFIRATVAGVTADRVERAAACGSELVANAVVHGAPPILLTVWSRADHILVAVTDTNRTPPSPRIARHSDPDGRGTVIVGRLADRWGVDFPPEGKRVWCLIDLPSA